MDGALARAVTGERNKKLDIRYFFQFKNVKLKFGTLTRESITAHTDFKTALILLDK